MLREQPPRLSGSSRHPHQHWRNGSSTHCVPMGGVSLALAGRRLRLCGSRSTTRPLATRVVPVTGTWTALFTNGPLGTDVGVLPERASRDLRVRGIRAVHIARGRVWPARTLEVYSPSGAESGVTSRVLYSMNDGGRWRFWNSGEPFTFEESADYSSYAKATASTRTRCTGTFGISRYRSMSSQIGAPLWSCARRELSQQSSRPRSNNRDETRPENSWWMQRTIDENCSCRRLPAST